MWWEGPSKFGCGESSPPPPEDQFSSWEFHLVGILMFLMLDATEHHFTARDKFESQCIFLQRQTAEQLSILSLKTNQSHPQCSLLCLLVLGFVHFEWSLGHFFFIKCTAIPRKSCVHRYNALLLFHYKIAAKFSAINFPIAHCKHHFLY